jgi:hypothetical protein
MNNSISDWEYCPVCVKYHAPNKHLPLYEVWDTDGAEHPEFKPDITDIHADDHGDAAEKWASLEDTNSAEYAIVSGRRTPTVAVRRQGDPDDKIVFYNIIGEAVPEYTATFKHPQPNKE